MFTYVTVHVIVLRTINAGNITTTVIKNVMKHQQLSVSVYRIPKLKAVLLWFYNILTYGILIYVEAICNKQLVLFV